MHASITGARAHTEANPRDAVFTKETPIIRELQALQDALGAIREEVPHKAAQEAARAALSVRRKNPSMHPRLDDVIETSLRLVAGMPLPQKPESPPFDGKDLVEIAASSWLHVAHGHADESAYVVEDCLNERGALHRTALYLWLAAIERLRAKDLQEARRLWLQAIELGECLGTESHVAILWSYVASFFPSEKKTLL